MIDLIIVLGSIFAVCSMAFSIYKAMKFGQCSGCSKCRKKCSKRGTT